MNKRVAIIGSGPCGLSQLRAFQQAQAKGADIPEVVCFERQSDWGGLWHYTWRTGLDEHGEPVHCSMYRYLWTNGPKECLEFGDYSFEEHFGKPIPSFPPYAVLNNYILGRAEKSDVRKYVRFSTAVRDVRYSEATGRFTVRSTDLNEQTDRDEEFDHVIVATGHFSVPNVPSFEGIDRFPGRVLHAHDFRDALEFKGKRLLIVGGSYSAEDIALQNLKYGAASVTCTYRSGAMGFKWPEGIEELPLVTKFEGNTAHFGDGSTREIDAVILCTGYQHHFPFMEDALRLRTGNRLWPPGLYKGVVWLDNTKLFYLGMQDQYYTFSMFDAQAWYVRDVILGGIALPSREEMEKDTAGGRRAKRRSRTRFRTSTTRPTTARTSPPAPTTRWTGTSSATTSSTGSTTRKRTSRATATTRIRRRSPACRPRCTTRSGGRPWTTRWRRSWTPGSARAAEACAVRACAESRLLRPSLRHRRTGPRIRDW